MMTDNLFLKILNKQIPAKIAYEDEKYIAIHDINPQAPVHVLVIPKDHYANLSEASADPELLAAMARTAHEVAIDEGIASSGFRVVFNTGADAGQTVFHVHAHLLGGRGLGWPPG